MEKFYITQKNNLWYGSFPLFDKFGFINACSCRLHGKSSVVQDTLNLALHVKDNEQMVLCNRRAFAAAIGVDADKFTTCQQVHGEKIAVVDKSMVGRGAVSLSDTVADTDALITDLPDVPLLLFYADCVPVLLTDTKSGCIGLAHAGWRGSVAEIALKTVQKMQEAFCCRPQDMIAAIGPSIGSCCYEVDDFVFDKAQGYHECFKPKKNGKYYLDLWQMNKLQLIKSGILKDNIVVAGVCTAHNSELFCSYRAEQGITGRMSVCLCRK